MMSFTHIRRLGDEPYIWLLAFWGVRNASCIDDDRIGVVIGTPIGAFCASKCFNDNERVSVSCQRGRSLGSSGDSSPQPDASRRSRAEDCRGSARPGAVCG